MPLIVAAQVADPAAAFTQVVVTQALGTALLLLPMTLALGATFPLALAVAGGRLRVSDASAGQGGASAIGRDAARVYTANTIGAIAGALIAGFALVPALGLRLTFQTAGDHRRPRRRGLSGRRAAANVERRTRTSNAERRTTNAERRTSRRVPATVAIAVARADPAAARAGIASCSRAAPTSTRRISAPTNFDTVLRAGTLEYYKEGAAATVSVRRLTGTTSLAIDGKVDASNAGDMLTQRMLGLLPVLIHGKARDICIIGLGSGVTLGSALASGAVEHADVVEISPEVVEASHFFDRENGGALAKPGVRLDRRRRPIAPAADAAALRRDRVGAVEPVDGRRRVALHAGVLRGGARAAETGRPALPVGAHLRHQPRRICSRSSRTFASVFPQGTLWMVGGGDLLLIGARDGEILPRLAAVEPGSRRGTVAATLVDVGIAEGTAPFALLSQFAGGPREMERYGAGALIQTDDRTALEYSAPRGIYGRSREDNAAAIRALATDQPPAVRDAFERATDADWTSRGLMDLKAQAFAHAYDAFRQAVTLNSRNAAALSGLSDAAGGAGQARRRTSAAARNRRAASRPTRPSGSSCRACWRSPATSRARSRPRPSALRLAPDEPRAAEQLASVLADAGDGERLAPLADAMVARFPDRLEARYYRATALFLRGKPQETRSPPRARSWTRGRTTRARKACSARRAPRSAQRDCALAAFSAAIRENPRDASGYVNAGLLTLQSGNPSAAVDYFASALTIDPSSKPARDGLAQARSPKF